MARVLLADEQNGAATRPRNGRGPLACLLAALMLVAGLGRSPAPACFGQTAAAEPEDDSAAVEPGLADPDFMPAKRSVVLLLQRTEELLQANRYAEAVQCLDKILSGSEDFFFRPDKDAPVHRSIKSEARRLLGTLPAEGRRSYELQFGALAQSALDSAIAAGDISMIAEVARRFFHTEAGYEATFLLGLHHFDHGRPLVAALTLRRLRDESTTSERFEPQLSLAMARSWLDAGMPDDAREALQSLPDRYAANKVLIEGRPRPLFEAGEDPLQWLEASMGPAHSDGSASASDWTMHGGSPQRVAVSSGSRPLMSSRWHVWSFDRGTVETMIDQLARQQEDRQMPLRPAIYPIVLGNIVLTRTTSNLLAVDFSTGKRLWEVPAADPVEAAMAPLPDGFANIQPNLEAGLRLRLWADVTFGTLASDGRLVFAVEDLPLPLDAIYSGTLIAAGNRVARPDFRRTYNRLAAYEIRSEGKLRWELGGPHSDDPLPLAGAFFLGPPLPLLGDLYVLAEIDGEIRLLALKADSGQLLWQQQLAVVEQSVYQDLLRRVSGISPSYGDGILVCPTSNHSVVALDMTARALLWGYSYADTDRNERDVPTILRAARHRSANPENRWLDSSVVVAEGRVLCTPADSEQLHCLSLRDGKLLWRIPREDMLFVAAVAEGKVVLAARRGLTALSLETGKPAWETPLAACPADSEPSGRGFSDDEFYHLPMTRGKLMTVRLATGKVEQVVRSRDHRTLGNLVCHNGKILSQRVDGIESYDQLEALRSQVDRLLAARPGDAQALALRGEIFWEDGKLDDAVENLRASLQASPSARAGQLLRDVMFEGLQKDFARYQAFHDEIADLLETAEDRATLHRLMAAGWQTAGQYDRALAEYRALVDQAVERVGFLQLAEDHWIREDQWIQARLRGLYESAPQEIRAELVRWSQEALHDQKSAGKAGERCLLSCFGGLPEINQFKNDWIQRLIKAQRLSEAEQAMIADIRDCPGEIQASRLARWATMLTDAGRFSDAAVLLQQIETRWAGVPFADAQNAQRWAARFTEQHDPVRQARSPAVWPLGLVKTEVRPVEQGTLAVNYVRGQLPLQNRKGMFFKDLIIEHQPQHLIARNSLGQVQWRLPYAQFGEVGQLALARGTMPVGACGHLLILSLGSQVIALDTLRTNEDGTPAVAWKEPLDQAGLAASRRHLFPSGAGNGPFVMIDGNLGFRSLGYSAGGGLTLGESLVCVTRSRVFTALDPATGETLWKRDGIPTQSVIFGDDHYVVVVPRQSTEARIFRTTDGMELEPRTVPPEPQRLATVGRRIVCWEEQQQGFLLKMVDPIASAQESVVWGPFPFPATARQQLVEGEAIAIYTAEGRFRLIHLADGRSIVDTELKLQQPLTDVVVLPRRGQYLVVANNRVIHVDPKRQIHDVSGLNSRPIGSARIFAFDDHGKPLWKQPTEIHDQFMPLVQPRDVPCLTFIRAVQELTPNRPRQPKIGILCVDTRTGAIVAHREFNQGSNTFEIAALPQQSRVEIRMQQETFDLQFTNEPIPEGATVYDAEELPPNPLEAIWRAVLREAGVPGEGFDFGDSSLPFSEEESDRTSDAADQGSGQARPARAAEKQPSQKKVPPPLEPAIRDRIPADLAPAR